MPEPEEEIAVDEDQVTNGEVDELFEAAKGLTEQQRLVLAARLAGLEPTKEKAEPEVEGEEAEEVVEEETANDTDPNVFEIDGISYLDASKAYGSGLMNGGQFAPFMAELKKRKKDALRG